MATKVLVVEDDPALRETIVYRLQIEGYAVITANDGPKAIEIACANTPDLILLDVMLPGMDGFLVCRQLRACCIPQQRVPILMLTARVDVDDKVMGLENGADDYITKPFSWSELRARIRAHLRRVESDPMRIQDPHEGILEVLDLRIDLDQRLVLRGDKPIELTARLFDLLVYFVRHKGIVLTRSRLLERVWGFDYEGDSTTVNVYVRWLREKLERDPANPEYILTVRGVGYRFKGAGVQ